MPTWIRAMLATPDEPPTTLARYTQACGVFYMLVGASFYLFPAGMEAGGAQTLAGQEAGLLRVVGMAVGIIGWFYLMGGRTNADSFGLATVADRLLVPAFLLPLAFTGAVDPMLVVPFAILDPVLALVALGLWYRQQR